MIAHPTRTSGTTGKPLVAGFTRADMQRRFAFLFRMLGEAGINDRSRSVRFSGGTFFPDADVNKIFWRINYCQNQAFMSSYHLNQNNVIYYIDFLLKFKPEYFDGYQSALYLLSKLIINHGLSSSFSFVKIFMSTGETLEDYHVAVISEAFPNVKILNQYASAEGSPFITQNILGELVVNIDSGFFEFVKPGTNLPASNGELAEMLVTSFTTHAYPLIRYRIGDTVIVSDKFSKSWNMPVVDSIYGRRDDLVWTSYRGWVGRLSPALKLGSVRIRESQIVQISPNLFMLRVFLIADDDTSNDISPIVGGLKERLGPVEIDVEILNKPIPRGANGKLRSIIALPINKLPLDASL
jgi:phenylacetate-CoA ligase